MIWRPANKVVFGNEESDPQNEYVHRVPTEDLQAYVRKEVPKVRAVCGKLWAPQDFNERNLRARNNNCPICFPPRREFAVAV